MKIHFAATRASVRPASTIIEVGSPPGAKPTPKSSKKKRLTKIDPPGQTQQHQHIDHDHARKSRRWCHHFRKCWHEFRKSVKLQGTENYLFAFGSWEIMEKNSGKLSELLDFLVYRVMELFAQLIIVIYYVTRSNRLVYSRLVFWNIMLHLAYSMTTTFNVLTEDKFRSRVAAARDEEEYMSSLHVAPIDSELTGTNLPLTRTNQAIWLLANIYYTATMAITMLYFLAPPENSRDYLLRVYSPIIAMVDLVFTAFPIRFVHVIYPWTYTLVYIIYSIMYQRYLVADSTPIYPQVNYLHPETGPGRPLWIIVLGPFVGTFIIHCLIALVSRARNWVMKYCAATTEAEILEMELEDIEVAKASSLTSLKTLGSVKGQRLIEVEDEHGVKEFIMLRHLTRHQVQRYLDRHESVGTRLAFLAEYEEAITEKETTATDKAKDKELDSEEERERQLKLDMIRLRFQQGARTFMNMFHDVKSKSKTDAEAAAEAAAAEGTLPDPTDLRPLPKSDTELLAEQKKLSDTLLLTKYAMSGTEHSVKSRVAGELYANAADSMKGRRHSGDSEDGDGNEADDDEEAEGQHKRSGRKKHKKKRKAGHKQGLTNLHEEATANPKEETFYKLRDPKDTITVAESGFKVHVTRARTQLNKPWRRRRRSFNANKPPNELIAGSAHSGVKVEPEMVPEDEDQKGTSDDNILRPLPFLLIGRPKVKAARRLSFPAENPVQIPKRNWRRVNKQRNHGEEQRKRSSLTPPPPEPWKD